MISIRLEDGTFYDGTAALNNYLGPATPRYGFTDTNAPATPRRFYRLSWP